MLSSPSLSNGKPVRSLPIFISADIFDRYLNLALGDCEELKAEHCAQAGNKIGGALVLFEQPKFKCYKVSIASGPINIAHYYWNQGLADKTYTGDRPCQPLLSGY